MSSLLDQVLNNMENPTAESVLSPRADTQHTLSDGSVIYDSTIAAINRMLSVNPHLHKRFTGVEGEYRLYNGYAPVDLDDKITFLNLLRADWTPASPFQTAFLIRKVIELAPLLSKDCIVVPPNLLWDSSSGRLKKMTEKELNKIRTVS